MSQMVQAVCISAQCFVRHLDGAYQFSCKSVDRNCNFSLFENSKKKQAKFTRENIYGGPLPHFKVTGYPKKIRTQYIFAF